MIGLVLLFYLALSPWKPNGLAFYLNASWVLALYLQDLKVASLGIFFHTWSLAMEEQFYLVWPAMEKFASRTGKFAFLGALLLLCQASNFGITDHIVDRFYGFPEAHLRSLFLCTFTPIIFGVILAHLLHNPKTFTVIASLCRWPITIPCLLAVSVVAAELSGGNLRALPRLVIHVAMTLLLGSIALNPRGLTTRVLQIRPLAFVGRISYGVYLYHITVLALVLGGMHVVHIDKPTVINIVLTVVPITVFIAAISYRWIEAPLLRLRPSPFGVGHVASHPCQSACGMNSKLLSHFYVVFATVATYMPGSQEYVERELFEPWCGRGLLVEAPAVRQ